MISPRLHNVFYVPALTNTVLLKDNEFSTAAQKHKWPIFLFVFNKTLLKINWQTILSIWTVGCEHKYVSLIGLRWTIQHFIELMQYFYCSCRGEVVEKVDFIVPREGDASPQCVFVPPEHTFTYYNIFVQNTVCYCDRPHYSHLSVLYLGPDGSRVRNGLGGVSKVMCYGESHVSDVTLVEIWEIGGWETNDFWSSVCDTGLWGLFMKTSSHMLWNIWIAFAMLSMNAWVHVVLHQDTKRCFEHHLLKCSDEWIFVSWSHTDSTHSVRVATD